MDSVGRGDSPVAHGPKVLLTTEGQPSVLVDRGVLVRLIKPSRFSRTSRRVWLEILAVGVEIEVGIAERLARLAVDAAIVGLEQVDSRWRGSLETLERAAPVASRALVAAIIDCDAIGAGLAAV